MFARCPEEFSHIRMAQLSVAHPQATFSAPRPLRATLGVKAVMIHRLTCRHASGVALGHCLQTGAAVERRKAMSAPE
jgi:hypothetical protein